LKQGKGAANNLIICMIFPSQAFKIFSVIPH